MKYMFEAKQAFLFLRKLRLEVGEGRLERGVGLRDEGSGA